MQPGNEKRIAMAGAGARACRCGYTATSWPVECWGRRDRDGFVKSSEAVYLRRCPWCLRLQGEVPRGFRRVRFVPFRERLGRWLVSVKYRLLAWAAGVKIHHEGTKNTKVGTKEEKELGQ